MASTKGALCLAMSIDRAPIILYWTVSVAVVDCDSVPEVAVIVSCDEPTGVPFIALAHPAKTAPLISSSTSGTMAA